MTTNVLKGHKGFVRRPLAERFWEKVDRRTSDECWPWLGSKSSYERPYGQIWVAGATRRAHAVAWELHHGHPIPEGFEACHSCDSPSCANPAHIFLGTHRENMLDAARKKRLRNQNTSKTHCSRGHEFTLKDTGFRKTGERYCRACHREQYHERKARAVLAKPAKLEAR